MNAQEMFKELGFKYSYYNAEIGKDYYPTHHISYTNYKGEIEFRYLDTERNRSGLSYSIRNKKAYWSISINGKIHQAIHQQMKELGWIE